MGTTLRTMNPVLWKTTMPEETAPEIPKETAPEVPKEADATPEPVKAAVEPPVKPSEVKVSVAQPTAAPEVKASIAQPAESPAVAAAQPVEVPEKTEEKPTPPPKPPRPAPAPAATDAPAEGAPPARAKPAAVEVKPLADYIKEDLQPLLLKRLQAEGAADMEITTGEAELTATWDAGDKTFTLYFDEGSLDGRKTIASSRAKSRGRNVQMFMPPERGFKGVDAKTITAMIVTQFTTTLTWIKKPLAKAGKKK